MRGNQKNRLAGHRSCSFVVKREPAYSSLSHVGLSCDVGLRNHLRDCPMITAMISGCFIGAESEQPRITARLFPISTLGPASLSIRLVRLPVVTATEHNTENQKFGQHGVLSFGCYSTWGTRPKVMNDERMCPNSGTQRPVESAKESPSTPKPGSLE